MQDGKGNVRHRFKSPEINAVGGSVMEPYEETKTVSYELRVINVASYTYFLSSLKVTETFYD